MKESKVEVSPNTAIVRVKTPHSIVRSTFTNEPPSTFRPSNLPVLNSITDNKTVLGFKQGLVGIQTPSVIGGELTFFFLNAGLEVDIKQPFEGLPQKRCE
ncbi:MAG: hypothetical protein D8M57_06655 [Candidatus Scalindua sp. AMX11]|nr:MAG: hypothetical protein DWQ00_13740 [Candidatus Scalindua sp.]TDE65762.1 MAG: hypothetical protein D8M57_06655 [Candidatus Scalindua sp. AMX11]